MLFATLWTIARQAPLSLGFSRQEYRSGLPFPSQGDLPDPGIKPTSLLSPASVGSLPLAPPGKPCGCCEVASVVSDPVRPHRPKPNRLCRPWDSKGKNTGVGCHFLLHCVKVKSESEAAQSRLTRSDPMDCSPPGSSIHGIF